MVLWFRSFGKNLVINDYRIFVERLMPNKSSVLPFLQDNEPSVNTWARVVMTKRNVWGGKDGGISEWMVSLVHDVDEDAHP